MNTYPSPSRLFWRFLLAFIFLALCFTLPPHATPASPAAPEPPPASAPASEASGPTLTHYLNPDGTLNLPKEGILGSIDVAGYQLVSAEGEGPRFAPVEGDVPEYGEDDGNWDPRFNQTGVGNYYVNALAWDGTNLYAGMDWNDNWGPRNSVVRWDGSTWMPLGVGPLGNVYALLWDGENLYAGGSFCSVGMPDNFTGGVVRWDGVSWHAVGDGGGTACYVRALVWDGINLYAG